jgi:arylsulfatase A-like enzyme
VLQGGSVERGPLYWSFMDGLAMRDGEWKLVIGEDGNEQPLLFDLGSDLGEKLEVSAEEPDRTDQMTRQARDWLAEVEASATAQPSRELQ